jgi:predicted transposase/invertase (TIGR01784 family)
MAVKSKKANRKIKDTVFRRLFGDVPAVLELYNAIAETSYKQEDEVSIVTLENPAYLTPINDISFKIGNKLVVLIEHQSTVNANMPLRMLLYIARVYEQILDEADKYRCNLRPIPRPDFIMLYNGTDELPDKIILKLSDMFIDCEMEHPVNLELVVRVYNINNGRNPEIARRSATLNGYVVFVSKVREYEKAMEREPAIDRAMEECIKECLLVDFLQKHRKAVKNMLTAEWKLEDAVKVSREEGEAIGEARGEVRGEANKARIVAKKMKDKGMDLNTIIELTGLPVDDVLKL